MESIVPVSVTRTRSTVSPLYVRAPKGQRVFDGLFSVERPGTLKLLLAEATSRKERDQRSQEELEPTPEGLLARRLRGTHSVPSRSDWTALPRSSFWSS